LRNSDAERVARTHFFYPPHDPRVEITLSLMTPSTKRLWNSNVFVLNGRFPIAPANVAGALRILCLAPSVVEQRRKCTQAVMSVGHANAIVAEIRRNNRSMCIDIDDYYSNART